MVKVGILMGSDSDLEVMKKAADMLEKFGISVENRNYESFRVPGNQAYQARDIAVEADWSQAGFWYAAAFLDNSVQPAGLNPASAQGDKVVSELYWKLARPGDLILTVGAGDIYRAGEKILDKD